MKLKEDLKHKIVFILLISVCNYFKLFFYINQDKPALNMFCFL